MKVHNVDGFAGRSNNIIVAPSESIGVHPEGVWFSTSPVLGP